MRPLSVEQVMAELDASPLLCAVCDRPGPLVEWRRDVWTHRECPLKGKGRDRT